MLSERFIFAMPGLQIYGAKDAVSELEERLLLSDIP